MAELPIADFLRQRLQEYDKTFEVRKGSAFDDLYFKPLQYILQPFRDEADQLFIGQSMRRILQTEDPDAFDEEMVDDLVANVFVYRNEGGKSSGVARVYYSLPVYREYPANGFTVSGSNGLNYTNPAPYICTDGTMGSQIEEGLYYMDVPVQSVDSGLVTELPVDSLVTVVGDPDYISVTNKVRVAGGVDRETNTQLIERAKKAITVRDLVTGKGFESILFENFPSFLKEVQPIGFGDEEMMRDIVFNTHIGGKHDGYVKTSAITTTYKDFLSVLIDTTRAAKTTTQLQLFGTTSYFLGEVNVDRTIANPVVQQVKTSKAAYFTGGADVSNPANLTTKTTVKIGIDNNIREVRVAGAVPSTTNRTEIINSINNAFGVDVAFAYDKYIRIISPNPGLGSSVTIMPLSVVDQPKNASLEIFGLDPYTDLPHYAGTDPLDLSPLTGTESAGDGPIVFVEDNHYTIDNNNGEIFRVLGPVVPLTPSAYGTITGTSLVPSNILDAGSGNPGVFENCIANDIVTVTGLLSPNDIYNGDYRITKVTSTQIVELDTYFPVTLNLDGKFSVRRTGIKSGELVFVEFYFNPLSIDIGKYIPIADPGTVPPEITGKTRGIRPGREYLTITDVAFLKINSIEIIDGITGEPLGLPLEGNGGFGRGGYGQGAYGMGAGADYRLVVNTPTARFSAFEDSYIIISSGYQGYSFRVHYDCVPEVESIHTFCRSDSERVLDGDILIKHYIPAYVSGTITYQADDTDSSIPDNDALTALVKDFVNNRESGTDLQLSDIAQFILKNVDPYYRYTGSVKPYTLTATIHNTDGSKSIISSGEALSIPKPVPFPKDTTRPLSPRTAHWIADAIELVRI